MPNITISVDDDFIIRLAKALNGRLGNEAEQTAAEAGLTPGQPAAQASQPDPWDNSWPGTPDAAAPVSAPLPPPPPPPPAQARTITVNTAKGAQQWTLGAPGAPACQCGNAAAYVAGATNGRQWKRWACALGADSNSWRNKCDFSQWA